MMTCGNNKYTAVYHSALNVETANVELSPADICQLYLKLEQASY